MISLSSTLILSVILFSFISVLIFISHEIKIGMTIPDELHKVSQFRSNIASRVEAFIPNFEKVTLNEEEHINNLKNHFENELIESGHESEEKSELNENGIILSKNDNVYKSNIQKDFQSYELNYTEEDKKKQKYEEDNFASTLVLPGKLVCNNKVVTSEIIYWKIVPGDSSYESPITPHHENHHDRYLSFEYDHGGWNNVRMSLECLIVAAHAMGRTLVIPPQQNLYLLYKKHKDKHDEVAHGQMGFEDFFDIELLRSHKGFHVLHMEEFLEKEGVTGGLHGVLPPKNSTQAWGRELWTYLDKNADVTPEWAGHYIAFPDQPGDFSMQAGFTSKTKARMELMSGGRSPIYYDEKLQQAHHIHFPGDEKHRIIQHHYSFAFFADIEMQSFYKRFVRDYMRYNDEIQCAGAELVAAVRADSLRTNPNDKGIYYALHIRRGDFQFKEVKISAADILKNLHLDSKTPIIPSGALVYLSTDDPDGICKDCLVKKKACNTYLEPKPVGCPSDPSWDAFKEAGWKLRFLNDYISPSAGANQVLKDVNPNVYGPVESIVCSRAASFAGTYFSTFTGYIHRLRGFHGLAETTYYHSPNKLMRAKSNESMGHGFAREFRTGWTDDVYGEII